jgi:hypothetical protein
MIERSARDDDQGAGEQADRLEREADQMEERSSELGEDVEGQRREWESKQEEDAVPGAQSEESLEPEVPGQPEPEEDEEENEGES